jgi:hypothetical protein
LSTGMPTAAKMRGRVTKLPEGIPPAPTLATSVVRTITPGVHQFDWTHSDFSPMLRTLTDNPTGWSSRTMTRPRYAKARTA